jgi:hypothetical protein
MKKRLLIVTLFLSLAFLLASCGGEETVPVFNYETVVSERDALQNELTSIQGIHDSLQREHTVLHNDLAVFTLENETLQSSYDTLRGEIAALQIAYNDFRLEAAGFLALNEAERNAAIEVASREDEVSELDLQIITLNGEIETLRNRITELQADVIRIAGESRRFPAGVLYVGTDIDAGRYRIYGGTSNFFVERNNRNVVNIILGGRLGVDEYIFTFRNGDVIEARSAFRLVPIG